VSELGDLFEATYEAPRCRMLHVRGHIWSDPSGLQRALDAWKGPGGAAVLTFSSEEPNEPPSRDSDPFAVWWASDGRVRTEQVDQLEIRADGMVRTFHPGVGALERPADPHDLSRPLVLSARTMLAAMVFEIRDASMRWHDRPVWEITAQPSGDRMPPMHPSHVTFQLPGHDYTVQIDKATGVILAAEARIDDDVTSWVRVDELEIDPVVDDRVFTFEAPDGSRVRTPNELTLEHLAREGVDVSGIDPNDSAQVSEAVRRHHEPFLARHRPPTVEQLAEDVPVLGPPPEDQVAARAAVTDAFTRMDETSEDGNDLLTVERGEGLGECLREAGERYTGGAKARFTVVHVRFVSDREAAVWYDVGHGGGTLHQVEGRSIRVGDEWLVTRATFCSLLRIAGVTCPPPRAR